MMFEQWVRGSLQMLVPELNDETACTTRTGYGDGTVHIARPSGD